MGHSVLQRASLALTDARHAGTKHSLERSPCSCRSSSAPAAHGVSIHPGGGQEGNGGEEDREMRTEARIPEAEPGTSAGCFICTTTCKPLDLCAGHCNYS